MKLIKQEVIDKTAEKFDREIPLGKLQTDYIFKAGVQFAEREITELCIEFANWCALGYKPTIAVGDASNKVKFWQKGSYQNKEYYYSTKELFEMFLKEKDNGN